MNLSKKTLIILIMFLVRVNHLFSQDQKVKFKTHYKVSITDTLTPIMVKKKLDKPQKKYKDYERHISNDGKETTIQKITFQEYSDESTPINSEVFTNSRYKNIRVGVKQNKNELTLYPYPFNEADDKIIKYLKEHRLVFKIEEGNNINLPFRGWEIGALTIPVKVYLSSRAEKLKNNFVFDESINLKISRIWGREYFYKKQEDDKGKSFQNYWSGSFFIGLSKTEVNNKNTTSDIGDDKFNVASLNYGLGIGYSVRSIGISALLGLDTPLSNEADDWNFKNQLWLGFGLGIDL